MPTVLIVDDQLVSRMILDHLVRSIADDVQAIAFADPLEALAWATENPFDLVLADYKMPRMDGIQFTQAIRELPGGADTPLVMVTCMDESPSVTRPWRPARPISSQSRSTTTSAGPAAATS